MKEVFSVITSISYLIKQMDMSYINWKTLAILVSICIFSLAVCFITYPDSNGQSIVQHIIFGQTEEF